MGGGGEGDDGILFERDFIIETKSKSCSSYRSDALRWSRGTRSRPEEGRWMDERREWEERERKDS